MCSLPTHRFVSKGQKPYWLKVGLPSIYRHEVNPRKPNLKEITKITDLGQTDFRDLA